MGPLDGGATAYMRRAEPHERNLNYPTVKVSLASGEGHLMISPEGTLLSVGRVSPIVSYTALRKRGERKKCDEDVFEVVCKENGPLEIDTSTGCPEVPRKVAEDLIDQYEALVRRRKVARARIAAVSHDLRLFPKAPEQLIDIAVSPPTDGKSSCWNRHKRRKARRGTFVRVFAGESKDSFVRCAHRTYTACRHIPAGSDAPRPVRSRDGPGRCGLDGMRCLRASCC